MLAVKIIVFGILPVIVGFAIYFGYMWRSAMKKVLDKAKEAQPKPTKNYVYYSDRCRFLGFGFVNCAIPWLDARQASEEELKRLREYEAKQLRQMQPKDEVIIVEATVIRDKPKALPEE